MKSIIGVDTGGTYEPAVKLFARLKFPNAEATLLNVADLVLPYTSFAMPPTVEPMNQIVEGLRQAGESAVADAAKLAESYGLETRQSVVSGPSVLTVLDQADELNVDVLAVASTRKGTLATMFTGSMSRSIVTGSRHTVLVAKEGVRDQGPIEAVLATDHSPYMERAVDRLLSLAPKGISKIHVVTAYEVSDKEAELLHANLPALDGHIEKWIEGKLREKCEALVGKLSQHGYAADYELSASQPNQAIHQAMTKTGSELLILGAQGHGFLERLFVGSVSFHQLVAEPYSVLILRDQ
jgi:nucleotide-binding universal stress UspA family protein